MNPPLPFSCHFHLSQSTGTQLGHDFMCVGQPAQQYQHENPATSYRPPPDFYEFQLFALDDNHNWLLNSTWIPSGCQKMNPLEELQPLVRGDLDVIPVSSFDDRLSLDVYCSTTSSFASQAMEFPSQPQVTCRNHIVSGCGTTTTEAIEGGADARKLNAGAATTESREARVSRYREKRSKRRFAKKIRYASRKAYAERRPRVKGRFVKSSEAL